MHLVDQPRTQGSPIPSSPTYVVYLYSQISFLRQMYRTVVEEASLKIKKRRRLIRALDPDLELCYYIDGDILRIAGTFLLLVQPPKMINYIVDEHYIDVESPLLNRVKVSLVFCVKKKLPWYFQMTEGIQGECCSITTSRWFTD
ncbi:hypothetical protein FEM48_Zijuj01G0137100 [Ziziphus jujuba var. spinosa]|uniref:Uncharacterized protein n=1 Tax=Ziziphus jujuba var. spinosa TaxID=714518 RepID=A0A978W1L3_ZIZJJ|nr:hypothetical protein FEM48_Zijuj01G0137100 [Ziziphus jujuba var. spinosa]